MTRAGVAARNADVAVLALSVLLSAVLLILGAVAAVATVAAVISYWHMSGLLAARGEDPINAHLGRLAVDGLMVIAAAARLATTRTSRT